MARAKSDSGPLSRREFLGATATVALSTGSLLKTARAQDASESKPWHSVMRRCGQINASERDPLTLDAEAWMDYWASLKVDAVLLNGGGILAFYPTRVPFHHRSQYLGSRDLFGEMVAAAKKRGLRVVARMDCNFAYAEASRPDQTPHFDLRRPPSRSEPKPRITGEQEVWSSPGESASSYDT